MTEIGQDHGGKSIAQVALNWVIRKGALPIPGAKNADQALQNAGALGWELNDEEWSPTWTPPATRSSPDNCMLLTQICGIPS